MRTGAKVIGWIVFALTAFSVGLVALGFLSIRSPLANGTLAPGPAPAAYGILLGTAVVGAAITGFFAAWIAEGVARMIGPQ